LEEVMVAKERPYDLVVSKYYLPGDEWYDAIVYDPKEGMRLFDNEMQAQAAGFTRATTS
jgi:hypothetical protein